MCSYVDCGCVLWFACLSVIKLYRVVPGDVCLLWGNIVHKFIKAPCSVTLAANSMSGYDMRRIATAYDYFVNETLTMRRGCGFREATCPTTGLSWSVREEWEPSLCAGVRRGSCSLAILLPWLLRCLDGGVDMSAATCCWIHEQQQHAEWLDKQESSWPTKLRIDNRWSTVIGLFTENVMTANEWQKQSSSIVNRWWSMPTHDEDVDAYDEHQTYQSARNTLIASMVRDGLMDIDSSERGIMVFKSQPHMHMSSLPTPTYYSERNGRPRSSKPFIDIETRKNGSVPKDTTYASIPFPHSTHDGLTSEWDRSDNGYAYTILGGAIHGSLHAGNGGGMFDWTAKYNDPDIGTDKKPGIAVTSDHLPYFNIFYHREAWSTTSTNLYVAFDHDEYQLLLNARTRYRSRVTSSSNDSSDDSDDDCDDDSDQHKRQRRNSE
jgi:hypothetical protein